MTGWHLCGLWPPAWSCSPATMPAPSCEPSSIGMCVMSAMHVPMCSVASGVLQQLGSGACTIMCPPESPSCIILHLSCLQGALPDNLQSGGGSLCLPCLIARESSLRCEIWVPDLSVCRLHKKLYNWTSWASLAHYSVTVLLAGDSCCAVRVMIWLHAFRASRHLMCHAAP